MTTVIGTVAKEVSITDGFLNFPVVQGIDRSGFWYTYIPANINNSALGAAIKPYRYGSELDLIGTANTLVMEGTMPLITEPWDGANTQYHGGNIDHIGAGINDITNTIEDDAFFFNHLGSLSTDPDDDAFYWDRAFLAQNSTEWNYYQYHQHLPTFYVQYENGRASFNGGNFIVPSDKSYANLIHTTVRVSSVNYQTVLARIHTPSVGGAHNSHNDVTLPSISNRNYQAGGVIKGSGDRFHAFYITADGSQWRVYNRTYIDASASFTAQVDLGMFDLADAVISPGAGTGSCHFYPVRASNGDILGTRIYFPVILNNSTSGFDLEIWSLTSSDTIAGGSLQRTVILSGQTSRPDAQCVAVGSQLYVLCSNINSGGASLFVYDGSSWSEATTRPITNGINDPVRIHGFRYNTEDVKFYALLSGNNTGTGNYSGAGLYSFNLSGDFSGYKHLDYDSSTNSFVERNPLQSGHLIYSITDGTIARSNTTEPQGIGSSVRILDYTAIKPNFFNKKRIDVGGDEFIFRGLKLKDNRKLLLGRVENLPYGKVRGTNADLLATLVRQDNVSMFHYAYGGIDGDAVDPSVGILGDDYIVSGVQSEIDNDKIWITGYTKSEFAPKKDIKIHGFCRNSSDSPNFLKWNDVVTDSSGSLYVVGSNGTEFANATKYSENYINRWQIQISADVDTSGEAIALDLSENVYIAGNMSDGNVYVSKIDKTTGAEIWTKTYGISAQTFIVGGITVVSKSSTEYVVLAAVNGTSTTFVVMNLNGSIVEQNIVSNLVCKRIRKQEIDSIGRFTFAGTNGSTAGRFGVCEVAGASRFVRWTSTFGTEAKEMRDIDGGATPGYIVVGKTSTSGSILKVTAAESGDNYTVTKSWARTLSSSEFNGVITTPYTETTRYAYVTGMTPTGGSPAMGMDEGLIAAYDNSGTLLWQNVYGHDMDESFNAITRDVTGYNFIVAGWSESHSDSRDAIIFRGENGGFGTGVYHLDGNAGVPYYYLVTALTDAADATSVTNLTAPSNVNGSVVMDDSQVFTYQDSGHLIRNFDGAYGENGLFQLYFGYIDLQELQSYLNTNEFKENQAAGRLVNYAPNAFTLWQVGTVGDGSADDGNIFGYDIIESSNGTIYVIGQTSGDIRKTNTGPTGVYDYLLIKFDPVTEEIEYYQNGTEFDEETYALCELSDGRIAFTGRTTGELGGLSEGGYDIFLGIYNTANDNIEYYSTGTGFDDRGMSIHNISNTELAIVYTTFGAFANTLIGNTTSFGSEDVGVIKFDYTTDQWSTAYQIGTSAGDIIIQNGKPSALLEDGRIAVVFSTGGVLDETVGAKGFLDIGLAILDFDTGEWTTAQVGSQSSEISTSVFALGERLLITGFITDSFSEEGEGIIVEADIQFGVGGKQSFV
jgi:hypothetical protein